MTENGTFFRTKSAFHNAMVYHDARMKFYFSHFFPKTSHFEHIIRHDIKIFNFFFFFLKKIWALKVQFKIALRVECRATQHKKMRAPYKRPILGNFEQYGTDMPYTVGKPEFQRFFWYLNFFLNSIFFCQK
jgi:hypothetical protein